MRILGLSLPLIVLLACNGDKDPNIPDTAGDTGDIDLSQIDQDGDGSSADLDCDDENPDIFPGADEVCDGIDNNCDDEVDNEAVDAPAWYADGDEDGYGDAERVDEAVSACELPSGYADNADDCDDYNPEVSPDAQEVCDGIDNDCDELTDSQDPTVDIKTTTTWFRDADSDSYGDLNDTTQSCDQPKGYVLDSTDCDDTLKIANPGTDEVCDGVDNDCDTITDEDDALDASTWYADVDGDSYGALKDTAVACDQPKGHVSDDTDCDDNDGAVNPGAQEVCNDIDDDCDAAIDDTDKSLDSSVGGTTYYTDSDGDGYGDPSASAVTCDLLSGYADNDDDCDDSDSAISPDAEEVCDEVDNDCDGDTDDADSSVDTSAGATYYADTDGDSYGNVSASVEACDQPSGYVSDDTDCDDGDSAVNTAATEVCDEIDNDCDGDIDDTDSSVSDTETFYRDFDGDGYGSPDYTVSACDQPSSYVSDDTDCDDTDSAINPAAAEVCDGDDNDCDGDTDDADSSLDASTQTTWYADSDADSYGDPDAGTDACDQPSGTVTDDSDCDDSDNAINPAATEVCDGDDNDCDGATDDADSSVDTTTGETFYADNDGDGYGDNTTGTDACDEPSGHVSDDSDCDDTDGNINPAATEVCDGDDNDCDGLVDDADSSVDASTQTTWYSDSDGDSYGDPTTGTGACDQPSGTVTDDSDCDDSDNTISPAATEVCDGDDNDCDGAIDDADSSVDTTTGETFYADNDGDGYGDNTTGADACDQPSGTVSDDTDCDDTDNTINPAATEVCDGDDNNCDGFADDDDSGVVGQPTWYSDLDGDSYGDSTDTIDACDQPSSYVSDGTDCDDSEEAVNPGEAEVCDSLDNDCDGDTDEDDDDIDSCYTGPTVSDLVEGDLVITEFMANPAAVSDSNGEWFEVYNASGDEVDLDGLVLADNAGSHTVSGSVLVAADSYAVFCLNDDSTANGSVTCDYDYASMALANGGDELSLSYSGTTFDEVDFSAWSVTSGRSYAFGSTSECGDVDDNDVEGVWCTEGTDQYNSTDYGSPGSENSADCFGSADYGYVTTSSAYSSAPSGVSIAWEITISSDSYLTEFEANSAFSGFGNLKLALYEDDSGKPGALIAQSEDTAEVTGNFTLDIDYDATSTDTCPEVLEAGTYWIVAKGTRSGSSSNMGYTTWTSSGSHSSYYTVESYSSDFPDPYSGTGWTATYRLHIGVVVDEQ